MSSIILNGELIPARGAFIQHPNRAFKYGDGIFETIAWRKGRMPLWEDHMARMIRSSVLMNFNMESMPEADFLLSQINRLIAAEDNKADFYRVRVSIFRQGSGTYLASDNNTGYLIEIDAIPGDPMKDVGSGKSIGFYDQSLKGIGLLAGIKTCSALHYVLASDHARFKGFDDVLILNQYTRICEATSSNVFVLKGDQLITPDITEACIPGIMRKQLIENAEKLGLKVVCGSLRESDLYDAEEVWLTNAIQGIRFVRSYREFQYKCDLASEMQDILRQKLDK